MATAIPSVLAETIVESLAEQAEVTAIAISQDGEISDVHWQALDDSDGILFGSPTYMGSVSWQFKRVADASSGRWMMQNWKDKLAGGFTNSASMNGDKFSTLAYLHTFAMQHGMLWVGTAVPAANTKAAQRNDVNYLGAFSGLMRSRPPMPAPMRRPCPAILKLPNCLLRVLLRSASVWPNAGKGAVSAAPQT